MAARPKMLLSFRDSKQQAAPKEMRGRYFHPKTGHLYRVTDFVFDAERERWMVVYAREDGGESFVHLPEDFNREGRFIRVQTDGADE